MDNGGGVSEVVAMAPIQPIAVRPASYDLCLHRLGLGQPERHVHGAVQFDGDGQFGTGWLLMADLRIQGAKAEVAVG